MKKLIPLLALVATLSTANAFTITDDAAFGRVIRPDPGKLLKLSGADVYTYNIYVAANVTDAQIAALVIEAPADDVAQTASRARAEKQITRLASTTTVEWMAGEAVATAAKRTHAAQTYTAIQPHITQTGWEPPHTPALWKLEQTANADGTPATWVQPTGGHDAYAKDALVTHGGKTWRSLINANVWPPSEGALWASGTAK